MSNQQPGGPREYVVQGGDERNFVQTATPGISKAVPSYKQHVVAGEAPTQFWGRQLPTGGLLAPGVGASGVLQWRAAGEVIGMYLSTDVNSPESFAAVGIKITAGPEQAALCMNGQSGSPDFVRFSGIQGVTPLVVAPFYRPVCSDDRWFIEVFNFDLHGTSYAPEITFHFRQCVRPGEIALLIQLAQMRR